MALPPWQDPDSPWYDPNHNPDDWHDGDTYGTPGGDGGPPPPPPGAPPGDEEPPPGNEEVPTPPAYTPPRADENRFPPQERYVPAPQDIELDNTIMDGIRDAMSGKLLPYNAETIARMRAASFQAAQGQADQAKTDLNRDMTRRGLTRSGLAVEQNAAINRNTGAVVTQGMRDTLVKAATENYKAKADALTRAESYLNQRQQFALANIRTTLDYQIASAQNTLAWARLRQEWAQLQAQLANALQIAREGNLARMEELFAQMGGR